MDIACDVDLERSLDSFHAYAVPDGIEIGPGDIVTVHGMPTHLAFGENRRFQGEARPCCVPAALRKMSGTRFSVGVRADRAYTKSALRPPMN